MTNRMMAIAVPIAFALTCPHALLAQTVADVQVVPLSVEIGVGDREAILVTAYDASGNVVPSAQFSWISSAPDVARVQAGAATPNVGYVIGVAPGMARVTVSIGSTSAIVSVEVIAAGGPVGEGVAATLQIQPNPILLLPAEEISLQTRFLRADGQLAARSPITWRSLLETVAAVDQRGGVVGISAGNGVIQATGAGGLVDRVVVQVANESFRFVRDALSLSPAWADSLSVIVPGQSNRSITNNQLRWASSNPAVVSISPVGVATGISPGTAEIIARGFGQQQRMTVTVHRPVASMSVRPRADTGPVMIPMNGTMQFDAVMYDASDSIVSQAQASWTVGDHNIISFDRATGQAKGLQMGTTTLTVRGPAGGLQAVWGITVVGPKIAFARDRMGMSVGEQGRVDASFFDDFGTLVGAATSGLRWSTLEPDVATVDSNGVVSAVGFGSTQVIADAEWGAADTTTVFVQGRLLVTKFADGSGDIFALDPDQPLVVSQITSNLGTEVSARYSPDGTRIAYVHSVDSQKVHIMNADGTGKRVLTDGIWPETSPQWTPDGTQIVYAAERRVWIVNADGTNRRALTSGDADADQPAVSPDGSTIAYRSTGGRAADIYLMSIDGSNQRPVMVTNEFESEPAWFPNGELAYLSEQGRRRDRTKVVVRHDLNTETAAFITPLTVLVENFDISPSGDTLAVTLQGTGDDRNIRKLFLILLSGPNQGVPVEVPRVDPADQYFFPAFKR